MSAATESDVAPETVAYRQYRRMVWQTIRSRYTEAVADAIADNRDIDHARQAGALVVRGELRALMSELLSRAPVPAVLEFLAQGQDWGVAGEKILERSDAVVELIESVDPRPTWTPIDLLDPAAATDDALVGVDARLGRCTLRHEFERVRAAEGSTAEQPQKFVEQSSALKRWAPWLVSAVAIVGVTAAVAVTSRSEWSPGPRARNSAACASRHLGQEREGGQP
ncbi:hypothetical protein [Nannocystis pusilla]|uniref:hypothetical protein n=1 Tax=Nannocystis pusilla TaxID=889268 RepID=UPI003B8190F8